MKLKLICLIQLTSIVFASSGYDIGRSAGKGILDISLTWNPFNYYEQGQSYVIMGYGLNKRIDLQAYYSYSHLYSDNYYGGILYQFYNSNNLYLSTAIGIRKYIRKKTTHFFAPQLLITKKINDRFTISGSLVSIRDSKNLKNIVGTTKDFSLAVKVFNSKKYQISISIGSFSPVLWKPDRGNWHPTYSIDFKINN
jgi:hypothetical protein